MTITDFFAAVGIINLPDVSSFVTFATLALSLAAPLAFLLAWKDKKEEMSKEELDSHWNNLMAELGVEIDVQPKLSWRQRAHQGLDLVFDAAEAAVKAVSAVKAFANRVFNLGKKAVSYIEAKVDQMIADAKAAAAEKAEKERLEAVKAEAKALGFVSREEVAEMIAKHEAMMHAAQAAAEKAEDSVDFEDIMLLVCDDQGVVETIPEGVVTIELIQNARVVVRKSVKDFDLSHKEGRAGARQYLRDNGISIPSHTNRHQIRSKFRLVA